MHDNCILERNLTECINIIEPAHEVLVRIAYVKNPPYNRGGSRISEKGVHMYKGVGVRSADFISFFLNIP